MPRHQAIAAKYMSETEVEALLKAVKDGRNPRDWALFQVMYRRGLRATEASLLQLDDYSISERRLFVHALKGSVSDEFWLTEMEAEALDAWLAIRGLAAGPLFPSRKHVTRANWSSTATYRPGSLVAHGENTYYALERNSGVQPPHSGTWAPGVPIQRGQIFRLMRKYCAAAGISPAKAHPHALRHSCGTHVLRLVKDMSAVQHWLRHKDIRSTQIYARFTRKEEIAEQLQGWGKKKA